MMSFSALQIAPQQSDEKGLPTDALTLTALVCLSNEFPTLLDTFETGKKYIVSNVLKVEDMPAGLEKTPLNLVPETFKMKVNGSPYTDAITLIGKGPFLACELDIPGISLHSGMSFQEHNSVIGKMFPEGVYLELTEWLQGPPRVFFKCTINGKFSGEWVAPDGASYRGGGEMVSVPMTCVAILESLDANQQAAKLKPRIAALEFYYNPLDQFLPLLKGVKTETKAPSPFSLFSLCGTA